MSIFILLFDFKVGKHRAIEKHIKTQMNEQTDLSDSIPGELGLPDGEGSTEMNLVSSNNNYDESKYTTENKQKIEMEIINWEYKPSKIKVKKDNLIIINLKNTSDSKHTFSLDKFGFSQVLLEPGQTTTIKFVPDRTGNYTFFCNWYCGDGHNTMYGELEVYE